MTVESRFQLTRRSIKELTQAIAPFTASYAGSSVTIEDDLAWWGEHNTEGGPEELAASRKAIEAAIPALRHAARAVLDILGDAA